MVDGPSTSERREVRILALDVGSKRIGVAVSDPLGITAQGLEVLIRKNLQADLARLFRSAGIDAIGLRTDQPYAAELGRFFETREKRRLRG